MESCYRDASVADVRESASRNRQGIANLQSRQPAHELPGTALADSKDALDGVAVKVIAFQDVEFGENGANSWEPGGFRRHRSSLPCLLYVRDDEAECHRGVFLAGTFRFGSDEPPATSRS